MNPSTSQPDISKLRHALREQMQAPEYFLRAWKQAVGLAGPQYFGNEISVDINQVRSKWDLCPKVALIANAIGCMSHGEQVFLAALVSVYDDAAGGELLQRVGVRGLADFGLLDAQRRALLASLIIHYSGW